MTEFNHIKTSLKELIDAREFRKEEAVVSNGFGDQFEVFRSKDFKLRLVSDRGQTFIDLSSLSGTEWHDLGLFFSILKNAPYANNKTETLVKFLKDQYGEIALLFSDKKWQDTQFQMKNLLASRSSS